MALTITVKEMEMIYLTDSRSGERLASVSLVRKFSGRQVSASIEAVKWIRIEREGRRKKVADEKG